MSGVSEKELEGKTSAKELIEVGYKRGVELFAMFDPVVTNDFLDPEWTYSDDRIGLLYTLAEEENLLFKRNMKDMEQDLQLKLEQE